MKFLKRTAPNQGGFTLLEVLLVVAIIGILAGIVILAVNPNKQLGDTYNSQRSADVTTVLNGVYQYQLDNNGTVPPLTGTRTGSVAISTTLTEICSAGASTCTGLVDLNILSTNGKYLVAIPSDPKCPSGPPACNANGAGYKIGLTTNGRLQVTAPQAEQGKTISVTR